jgi:hypothetical protein
VIAPVIDGAAPSFVVIIVKAAYAQVINICQLGIVGFHDEREVFAWEMQSLAGGTP